jgi:hypothetical protein
MKTVLSRALGLAACLALSCFALAGNPAMAQTTTDLSSLWNNGYARPDANNRAVDLGIATDVYAINHGGLATYNYTTNIGEQTNNQTVNGNLTDTSSTTAVNVNSMSAYLPGATDSMATFTVSQGSSGGVDQNANATTQSGKSNNNSTSGH